MPRRWFYLARNTAGQVGDMNKPGAHNIVPEGGRALLTWQPGKKGSKPVTVPIMAELAVGLGKDTGEEAASLRTEYGRPSASSGALDNIIPDWIIAAEPTGKDRKVSRSQQGIRKATARELAKAGASVFRSRRAPRTPTSSPARPGSKTPTAQVWCCPTASASRKPARQQASHTPKSAGHVPRKCR